MSIKIENKYSEISANLNNLGMAMEKLAIIRWINVPFQAIISLFIIFLQFSYIIENISYNIYYMYDIFWIPLIFGILYLFVSFSTLLRFMQYLLNLWNLGKNLQNSLIKKASIYQLIRIGLYGFIIILSLFLGFLILIPLYQFFYNLPKVRIGLYHSYPNFNVISIVIVSLLILFLIVVMKVFNILSIVSIDNWAERQKLKHISNENIHQLSTGTQLMKMAVFLELVNFLFGSIFYNIGLAKASQGFKKYSYQFVIDSDEHNPRLIPSPKIQTIKDNQEPMKITPHLHNSTQVDIKNEKCIKFCSYCGVNRSINHARYCFNCGSEYLEQNIEKKGKIDEF